MTVGRDASRFITAANRPFLAVSYGEPVHPQVAKG
jgi:hypothetical protein